MNSSRTGRVGASSALHLPARQENSWLTRRCLVVMVVMGLAHPCMIVKKSVLPFHGRAGRSPRKADRCLLLVRFGFNLLGFGRVLWCRFALRERLIDEAGHLDALFDAFILDEGNGRREP